MAVSRLGGTFRLRGWIGERKYYRPIVDPRHGLKHLRRESAADGRNADDRGGLERFDRGQKIADRRMIVRVAKLVLGEAGAILDDNFYFIANTGIYNLENDKIADPAELEPVHIAVVPLK